MQVTEDQKKKIDQVKTFLVTLFKRFKLTLDEDLKNFIPDAEKIVSVSYDPDVRPDPNVITLTSMMNEHHEFEVFGFASLIRLTDQGVDRSRLEQIAINCAYILGMTLQESHIICSNGADAIYIHDVNEDPYNPDYRVMLDLENFGL